MVGLASVKTVIHKAIAKHKINKLCMEKGLQRDNASLHMVFTGNPGTAKTTVARLFAEIMKDEKILSTGVFVEAGRADLVGEHVGATAPLVRKSLKKHKEEYFLLMRLIHCVTAMTMDLAMKTNQYDRSGDGKS